MGKHTQAPRLIDEEYLSPNFTDDDVRETILNGTDKMPPQRKNVNKEDIVEIIKYLRYSQKAAGLEPQEEEEEEEEWKFSQIIFYWYCFCSEDNNSVMELWENLLTYLGESFYKQNFLTGQVNLARLTRSFR